jgi:hypothetical protein
LYLLLAATDAMHSFDCCGGRDSIVVDASGSDLDEAPWQDKAPWQDQAP